LAFEQRHGRAVAMILGFVDGGAGAIRLTRARASGFARSRRASARPPFCYNARSMAARPRSNDFEKAFQNLEKIVQRLETEDMPLDESLQLFEEGIKLSRFCHQRLEEVEKKIELILADAKGQPVTEPFEDEELEEDEEIVE
jgi:exodeoxyribonuclease VII small subunit